MGAAHRSVCRSHASCNLGHSIMYEALHRRKRAFCDFGKMTRRSAQRERVQGKSLHPFSVSKKPFLTHWQTAKMFGRQATCTRRRTRVRGRLRAPLVADAASKKEWQRSKFEAAVSAAHKFWEPQQEGRKLRSTRKGYAASVARQNPCVASKKRLNFVSLRGRIAAVAILKVKVWHPVAKHGST